MSESIKKFIIKDAHGGTKESGSFSVVGEVHVDIVPGYGEPYAESVYVNGILTITIHNIEGNGITEITTDSQEGDEAVNTVTIKTNANPEGVVLEVRNGSRGNGIASSSEVLSPEDGGTNTHTIIDTDGNEHVFHTKNGRKGDKGDQGDSAIFTGEGEPWSGLKNTTGQSTTEPMTQKAVTDAIVAYKSVDAILTIGLLNTITGVYSLNSTRAMSDYLPPNTLVTCKEGYFIRGLYRFTQVNGTFTYVDFINYNTSIIPFSSCLTDNAYYVRVLFQKGDGTGDVSLGDIVSSVLNNGFFGCNLFPNVEGGSFTNSDPADYKLKKVNSNNRMRTAGIYSNTGMPISIKCKNGYQANIQWADDPGPTSKLSGWANEHYRLSANKSTYPYFFVVFKREDGASISSSDYNCVESFSFSDTPKEKFFSKSDRPSTGYETFSVSCNTNVADTVSTSLNEQDGEVLGNDTCRIYLPSTYNATGRPTRLVIHCHGASVNFNYSLANVGINDKVLNYLLAKGYAVLCPNGLAGNSTLRIGTTAGSPLAYQCHVKAYRYVMEKYNLRDDGVFVYGISAGSIPALQIANFTDIPVLAQIIYCGIYSVPRAFMLLGGYSDYAADMKQYIADQYDFQGSLENWSTTDPVSDDEWKYIIDNAKRFAGWNSYLRGASTRMSQEDYADFVGDFYGSNLPDWISSHDITFDSVDQLLMAIKVQQKNTESPTGDLLEAINAEKVLYDTVSIHRNVPLKIYHATNDATAPYRYAQYYYDMLKRGGSQVEFRTFTSGGHSPYGNDITVTVNGVSVNTCVFAIESLLFLQRFE